MTDIKYRKNEKSNHKREMKSISFFDIDFNPFLFMTLIPSGQKRWREQNGREKHNQESSYQYRVLIELGDRSSR